MCVCARVAPFCTTHKAAPALVVPASRFASPLEVQTLFQHAGLVDICNGKAEPGNADPAALLLQQLGGWQFADSPYPGAGARRVSRVTHMWIAAGFTDDPATYPIAAGPYTSQVRGSGGRRSRSGHA